MPDWEGELPWSSAANTRTSATAAPPDAVLEPESTSARQPPTCTLLKKAAGAATTPRKTSRRRSCPAHRYPRPRTRASASPSPHRSTSMGAPVPSYSGGRYIGSDTGSPDHYAGALGYDAFAGVAANKPLEHDGPALIDPALRPHLQIHAPYPFHPHLESSHILRRRLGNDTSGSSASASRSSFEPAGRGMSGRRDCSGDVHLLRGSALSGTRLVTRGSPALSPCLHALGAYTRMRVRAPGECVIGCSLVVYSPRVYPAQSGESSLNGGYDTHTRPPSAMPMSAHSPAYIEGGEWCRARVRGLHAVAAPRRARTRTPDAEHVGDAAARSLCARVCKRAVRDAVVLRRGRGWGIRHATYADERAAGEWERERGRERGDGGSAGDESELGSAAIQKVISNKRNALKAKAKQAAPAQRQEDHQESFREAPALAKLVGITAYSGREKFRDDRHDEIHEYSKSLPGPTNAGGKFCKAEALLWAKEDAAVWDAKAAVQDGVDWVERQKLVTTGFEQMVDNLHASRRFRPFVATMVMAWLNKDGKVIFETEAVPDDIVVPETFKKLNEPLVKKTLDAMYVWAEEPLKEYLSTHEAPTRRVSPVFPLSMEDLDDRSHKAIVQTLTDYLVASFDAAFDSREIPWEDIATEPEHYYDVTRFEFNFPLAEVADLSRAQVYELAAVLAAGAGTGTSGFFHAPTPSSHAGPPTRPHSPPSDTPPPCTPRSPRPHTPTGPGTPRPEAYLEREAEAARLKREAEEVARLKHEAEEAARLKRKAEEAARLTREADEAVRLKREAEEAARLKREAEERTRLSEEGGQPGSKRGGGRKRKAEEELPREDGSAPRRTGRTRQTVEEARLEREKKITATVGKKIKPSYEYVVKSPAKSTSKAGTRRDETQDLSELESCRNFSFWTELQFPWNSSPWAEVKKRSYLTSKVGGTNILSSEEGKGNGGSQDLVRDLKTCSGVDRQNLRKAPEVSGCFRASS
ncbi:hypothetical protein DFH07DRAFT_767392 [Mycena maculata]|uniref:Uncharacterized protein n=1 Tax=Mycena maculata TaxID=230809 RepID=A0AAD7NT83_9AGAR|nr:hypothetical protein DFH07DRAFT_767392 [Mycena maculata]